MKYEKCKVVMIATEKESDISIFKGSTGIYYKAKANSRTIYQHLYITSDEEIKEGDWAYSQLLINKISKVSEEDVREIRKEGYTVKKIIATNDTNLGLPRPSNEFIKVFCKKGGIDEVLVEYEVDENDERNWYVDCPSGKYSYDEPIPPSKNNLYSDAEYFKLKIAPDNTITIKSIKDSWDKEELINIVINFSTFYSGMEREKVKRQVDKWINQNL